MVETPYQKTNIVDENGDLVDFGAIGNGGDDASADNQTTQIGIEEEIRDRLLALNYSGSWTKIRDFASDTIPPTFNSRPSSPGGITPNIVNTNADFIAISGFSNQAASQLEILPKIKSNGAASFRLYLWVFDGTEIYTITPSGASPGENGLSVLNSNGAFDAVAPILVDLKRYSASLQVGCRILLDSPNIVFDASGNCINPGLLGGELVSLATTGILPIGLSGSIAAINQVNDQVVLSGVTLANTEMCRLNLQSIGANIIPFAGFSASGRCADVSTANNTLLLDGRTNDVVFTVGDTVRFRVAPGSILPSVAGSAIVTTTSYIIVSVSGSAGSQIIQISTDGVTPLTVTAFGTGIYFIFKFPFVNLFFKGTNQLSYSSGGSAIDFKNYYSSQAITISTAGTASVVTHTAHTYSNGQAITLGGGTAPTGGILGNTYFVINQSTNTYQLAHVPNGLAIAFTSAGASVISINPSTNIGTVVTVTIGTPATITLNNHFLSTNQVFTIGGSALPTGYNSQNLYIVATGLLTTAFQCSEVLNGASIVFGSVGTLTTINAAIAGVGFLPIEKLQAYTAVTPAPTDNTLSFANTANGTAIPLSGGNGIHSFTPAYPLKILTGSYVSVRSI
ncbi:hypothetical protein [Nostoc sp.]|uniref:hypothetical protein n=1 Tax=Nostoc sp. TaxID=1180 RepID=UPI002FF3AEF6